MEPSVAQAKAAPHKTVVYAWDVEGTLYPCQPFSASVGAKCLGGCSLEGKAVVVLDGTGQAVGRAVLPKAEEAGGLHRARIPLSSPATVGHPPYTVVVEPDEGHPAAQKPLRFTVLPKPDRTARIRVFDEKTDKPLADAAVLFFDRTIGKGRPLVAETNAEGVAEAALCSSSEYDVRVECENYNEGGCSIDAGGSDAEVSVPLLSVIYNKEVLGRPGYDPY